MTSIKKHTQISHVLERPDMYIGSVQTKTEEKWLIEKNAAGHLNVVRSIITFNPGLDQIIAEMIANAVDHVQRCIFQNKEPVTKIEVNIDSTSFSIKNNGSTSGIPIALHPKEGIYNAELVFGHLLTGTNFDDAVSRKWGGKNGVGVKATNIYSKEFTVEYVCDNMKYVQTWSNHMSEKTAAHITKCKSKDYMKITCKPDFKLFKLESFDDNNGGLSTRKLIEKRVYDMSAVTSKKVSITLNDSKIELKDFKDYIDLFLKDDDDDVKDDQVSVSQTSSTATKKTKKIMYETTDGNWAVGFALNPYSEATQISFVNGIFTENGGTHVTHCFEQVIKKVVEIIKELPRVKKEGITIKPQYIRDNLIIFVRCTISLSKDGFDNQLKNKFTLDSKDFDTKCVIPDDIISKIAKLGFIDSIIETARFKELKDLKKTVGTTTSRHSRINVDKLDDAIWAGTNKSDKCTLILTEGDSAAVTATQGLTVIGNDAYGVFPLKGKVLNVRKSSVNDLKKNEEINNILKILGLNYGITDKSKMRYSKIMIMADQDVDGLHIKGLLMSFFTYFFPEIVSDNFITTLLTPIVKVTLANKKTLEFYSEYEFEDWALANQNIKYDHKYYKGLGTANKKEAKLYFENILKNTLEYTFVKERDLPSLELAFADKHENERKQWINESIIKLSNKELRTNYKIKKVPISTFINHELVTFSIADCNRSLPSMIDGLKESQRKVLYGSLKKKLYTELKVAELGAYISEHTAYHHGDVSLTETIVKMAQDFVGSNNAPIFTQDGQFGSRNLGGKDSASSRYIFTHLQKWVPLVFKDNDSKILHYNYDDDKQIEPTNYVPILPMILINGAEGIGTGYASTVPSFRPKDIIKNIRTLIADDEAQITEMTPYYRYFKGTIIKLDKNKWVSKGLWSYGKTKKEVKITELPLDVWYTKYKTYLKSLEEKELLTFTNKPVADINGQDYEEYVIKLNKEYTDTELVKLLKLESNINATNLVGFDRNNIIKTYESAEQILWDFFETRRNLYKERKNYLEKDLAEQVHLISEKARFIKMVISNQLIVFKRPEEDICKDLEKHKFNTIDSSYNYLLNISIKSFTTKKVIDLENELATVTNELTTLKGKKPEDLWSEDLDQLESIDVFI